jgi:hypothetical protein
MNGKTTIISLRIIVMFTTGIMMSFLPDLIPDFFGDWVCKGSVWVEGVGDHFGSYSGCTYGDTGRHEATTHWGYRHWLYFFMGFSLFIVQVVDLINSINKKE